MTQALDSVRKLFSVPLDFVLIKEWNGMLGIMNLLYHGYRLFFFLKEKIVQES